MPARGRIVLPCLTSATTTVPIGAFPALLPELGATAGLARALALSPALVLSGAALRAGGGGFTMLVLGRARLRPLFARSQAADVGASGDAAAVTDRSGRRLTFLAVPAGAAIAPIVLGGILLVFALALIGFGTLPVVAVGWALFGFSMAGWMLALGILRAVTPAPQIAWRTASTACRWTAACSSGSSSRELTTRHVGVLPGVMLTVLAIVGLALILRATAAPPSR